MGAGGGGSHRAGVKCSLEGDPHGAESQQTPVVVAPGSKQQVAPSSGGLGNPPREGHTWSPGKQGPHHLPAPQRSH